MIWANIAGALDTKNPDARRRKEPLAGKDILKGYVFKSKGIWEDGTIYDPKVEKHIAVRLPVMKKEILV